MLVAFLVTSAQVLGDGASGALVPELVPAERLAGANTRLQVIDRGVGRSTSTDRSSTCLSRLAATRRRPAGSSNGAHRAEPHLDYKSPQRSATSPEQSDRRRWITAHARSPISQRNGALCRSPVPA
jgi:hypothetical protein